LISGTAGRSGHVLLNVPGGGRRRRGGRSRGVQSGKGDFVFNFFTDIFLYENFVAFFWLESYE
jgi:hypothetical protein